jgi:TatD DNase family protein
LDLALENNLPVIIHSREAFEDTREALAETRVLSRVGGVLHCFGGTADEAGTYLRLGAYIGFAGIVTFKKAANVKGAAQAVPWNRILVETDAPFLAPEPFRGKRNEPAYVIRVAEELARIKETPLEETARMTTENSATLFRLPAA